MNSLMCALKIHINRTLYKYSNISVLKLTKLVVLSIIFINIYKDCVKTPYKNDAIIFLPVTQKR